MPPRGIDAATVRALVARLPEAEERSHFGHPDFRVANKIFATLWPGEDGCNLRLPHALALELVGGEPAAFRLIAERGHIGWVGLALARADALALGELLTAAWRFRAPERLLDATPTSNGRRRRARRTDASA